MGRPGHGFIDSLRRTMPLLLALLALPAFTAAAQQAIRVGVYDNSPKVAMGADGRPEGIFPDVLAAIAAREGWVITYVPGTWQQGLERLASGDIDIMPDVALTPERAQSYAFHREPVLLSWSQVYARRGNSIRSVLDLQGLRIATLAGSIQHDQFVELATSFRLDVAIQPYPGFEEAFLAVESGHADAVVGNRFFGVRNAGRFGLVDTGILFSPAELYFAISPHRTGALPDTIDRQLRALKNEPDSAYHRSLAYWTTDESAPVLPEWFTWVALATALLLLAGALWIYTLRRTAHRLRASDARQQLLLHELAVARDAAEAADRAKSAFLATMSHELRTPLNSIIGFTGIILQGLAGPLNDEQRTQLGMVNDSAHHLLALINDVLDISKIESEQLAIAHESFDLVTSLDKAAGIVRPLAEKKGLAFKMLTTGNIGSMTGDARRLEQILVNLLGNAVKFTDRGSVTISAERIAGRERGDIVHFRVVDTGIGIRQEDIPTLFQPFHQLDSTLTRQREGSGLGLAISRRLAERMGGSITVESEPGNGSVFTLTLPASNIVREVAS
ncbi:MAG: ATP-binding protein [Gammaproteobacteria bacterium]